MCGVKGSGDWLKRSRMRVGYVRQEDLAHEMGVSRGAIANWETNKTRPSMANAERLAALLKRPRSEVLARFGYPVGGGEPAGALPAAIPPEWLAALRAEMSDAVAEGFQQVLETLRREGRLGEPAAPPPRRRPRSPS
jgi:transcriptional regulator with XRE-family HTH domain